MIMPELQPSNEQDTDVRKGVLAFIAILCITVSQILLFVLPQDDAATAMSFFWLSIAGVVLFLWSQFSRPSRSERIVFSRIRLPASAWRVLAGLAFSVLATVSMVLFENYGRTNFIPVTTLWLAGAACYLSAFFPNGLPPIHIRVWLRTHWMELLGVGSVTLLACVLRLFQLGELPRVINGDEGWLGNMAISTHELPLANPFALWENFGGIYLQAVNWVFSIAGQTAFALRLLPACSGILAVPALYLLAKQIAGPRIALIAAALLSFSHSHLNFSRTAAVGYIHDTWIVPLALYLLFSGLEKNRSWRTALAGLLLGLQLSIYLTAQIFIPLVLIYCLFILLFFRKKYPHPLRRLLPLWGGLGIAAIPTMAFAIYHPADFFNRLNVDGTFQSGWLTQKVIETGQSVFQILAGRVLHAFFSLIYYPAIDFYNSPVPLVSIVTASFFLLGLGISLWKTRSSGYLLLNGYFWGCTLAVGIFAIPESADSYRMLITLPAVMLFASIGLHQALSAVRLGWAQSHKGYILVTGFLIANLMFFNVWEYRVDFAGRCRYGGDPQTRFASYLGSYLRTVPRETTVYLLSDDIFRSGTHASTDFLGMRKAVINVPDPIDSIAVIAGDLIIASPNRIDELEEWAHRHPGGELLYTYDCETEIMDSYRVP
jgi:hypothetical protein